MPLEAKSLTQANILFLAICHGFIIFGASVLSTNISLFNTMFIPFVLIACFIMLFLSGEVTKSSLFTLSSKGLLKYEIKRSIISLSFNLFINRQHLLFNFVKKSRTLSGVDSTEILTACSVLED